LSGPTEHRRLSDGPDQHPIERLRPSDVPPPLTSDTEAVQLVNQFAHTLNGYDWAGSLEALTARYQRSKKENGYAATSFQTMSMYCARSSSSGSGRTGTAVGTAERGRPRVALRATRCNPPELPAEDRA
jgi:hypothetical protein